jgi:hypothetical protein
MGDRSTDIAVDTIAKIPDNEATRRNFFKGDDDPRFYTVLYGCDLCW